MRPLNRTNRIVTENKPIYKNQSTMAKHYLCLALLLSLSLNHVHGAVLPNPTDPSGPGSNTRMYVSVNLYTTPSQAQAIAEAQGLYVSPGERLPVEADEHRQATINGRKYSYFRVTAYVTFPRDRTEIRLDYMDNRRQLNSLVEVIDSIAADTTIRITSITLRGYASPEGPYRHNADLASGRMESLTRYVASRCPQMKDLMQTDYVPEDWEGLTRYIEQSDLLHREQILQIIETQVDPDLRERLIRQRYPEEYRQMFRDIYPLLRRTDLDIAYVLAHPEDTVPRSQPQPVEQVVQEPPTPPVYEEATEPMPPEAFDCDEGLSPWLAVKNNLLYDLILAPNLEIERWFGRKRNVSIMAEWGAPWYVWHHNSRAYEVLNVGGELRFWIHRTRPCRRWLTGAFIGLYCMAGKYDFEWNHKGYQGEHWSGGLTLGFAHRISRRWNMEYSVSAGYLATDYRRYYGMFNDRHLIWQHNGHTTYTGPTKAKISLVYFLGPSKKQKGGPM